MISIWWLLKIPTNSTRGNPQTALKKFPQQKNLKNALFHRTKMNSLQTVSTAASVTSKLIEPTICGELKHLPIFHFCAMHDFAYPNFPAAHVFPQAFPLEVKNYRENKIVGRCEKKNQARNFCVFLCMEIGLKRFCLASTFFFTHRSPFELSRMWVAVDVETKWKFNVITRRVKHSSRHGKLCSSL